MKGNGMRKFYVQNLSDRSVRIAIEPWADLEIVAPRGKVLFEYEERDEPAEIGFAIMSDERVVVDIVSDLIKITGGDGEKIFRTGPVPKSD